MWEQLAVPTVDSKIALRPDGVGAGLREVEVVGKGGGGWSAENDKRLRAERRNIGSV